MTAVLLWENKEDELHGDVYNRGRALLIKRMSLQNKSSVSLFRYVRISSFLARPSTPHLNVNKWKYCLKAEAALDRFYTNRYSIVSLLYTSSPKHCQGHTVLAQAIRLSVTQWIYTATHRQIIMIKKSDSRQTWHCTSQDKQSEEPPKFCFW